MRQEVRVLSAEGRTVRYDTLKYWHSSVQTCSTAKPAASARPARARRLYCKSFQCGSTRQR